MRSVLFGLGLFRGIHWRLGGSAVMALGLGIAATAVAAGGSGWSVQRTPSPKGGVLSAVSCSSGHECIAVGSSGWYKLGTAGLRVAVEHWDGHRWSIQPAPNPKTGGALLAGVSCASSAACVAVGQGIRHHRARPLIERWNGRRWSLQPSPQARGASLSAVSCPSVSVCTAVGEVPGGRAGRPLAERWNGREWSIQPTPNPDQGGSLTGVSCVSARACTAVGLSLRTGQALAERWNGRKWSIEPTPTIGTDTLSLASVSCTSARLCVAVGDDDLPPPCEYSGCYPTTKPLAERWDGRRWMIQQTPTSNLSGLRAVSCTSPRACTAIGSPTGAERWNGSTWTVERTPSIDEDLLGAVSCVSNTTCMAVGKQDDTTNIWRTLAERWKG